MQTRRITPIRPRIRAGLARRAPAVGREMLINAGISGLMARRTLLLGITAWQAHSVTMPAVAAQRGAEDAYAVRHKPSTNTHHNPTSI